MGVKNITIVTALFDIGRDKWDHFTMSYNTYCSWMRNLLYFNTNLIIYTEEKFKDDILNFRKEVDPNLEKTKIFIQPLETTEGYKTYNKPLENLMYSETFKKKIEFNVPEMNKPLYNVVMFSKLLYILDAYKSNLFDTHLYIWLDAGGIRKGQPDRNVKWPNIEKINNISNDKVTFFCHHNTVRVEKNIKEYERHALSQSRFIQGTAFFIPRNRVVKISDLFKKIALESISNGYVGSDEKIFDFVYLTDPSNFNLIKCDWREYFDLFN